MYFSKMHINITLIKR